ncbi:hypothetical protein PAHAL_3G022900 [Panicum hallii]|jgi:hypothetical protein|uniref:RNase H type-1 domain-containing protein n=1 Tax=Panicum hallii TaxID=206008 RepID=A0A2T8KGT8_9POAL|nr:hypothetical protein PAHAL_3G022900 [Panicum hallii]
MEVDTRCVVCNRLNEDGGHTSVNMSELFWQGVQMEDQRALLAGKSSPIEVIHHILQLKGEEQMKLIVLLWQWWNERNKIREGEKRRETKDLTYLIQRNAEDFLKLGVTEDECTHKPIERWQKPTDDFVKINSDGAFSASTGEGGWGYVIRDGDGEVICAGAGNLSHQK